MSLPAQLRNISPTVWELPVSDKEGMRVPARIIASEPLLGGMEAGVFDQAANVACLPGIINYSYCMPDGHCGYGFPIDGVAAMCNSRLHANYASSAFAVIQGVSCASSSY